jgi:hypothetical protein
MKTRTQIFCRKCFGDGVMWAGCVMVNMLEEEQRYKAFDYTRYLGSVHEADKKGSIATNSVADIPVWRIRDKHLARLYELRRNLVNFCNWDNFITI